MEQTRLLLGIPGADDLPEVLDDLVLLLVTTVVGVLLPVVDVDISDTTDEKLKLALIEHIDKIGWDQLVESGHESVELFLHSLHNLPFSNQPVDVSQMILWGFSNRENSLDVLWLVLVGDGNIPTTWY